MRIISLLLLLAAGPVPSRLAPGYNSIRETNLRANLRFLASDGMQGRLSLQPGDDAAAEWVASEFAKAGLQPAAANNSFLQPVPLIEFRNDRAQSFLALGDKRFKFPDAYGSFPKDVEVKGDCRVRRLRHYRARIAL